MCCVCLSHVMLLSYPRGKHTIVLAAAIVRMTQGGQFMSHEKPLYFQFYYFWASSCVENSYIKIGCWCDVQD